jgi:hypothetical protein
VSTRHQRWLRAVRQRRLWFRRSEQYRAVLRFDVEHPRVPAGRHRGDRAAPRHQRQYGTGRTVGGPCRNPNAHSDTDISTDSDYNSAPSESHGDRYADIVPDLYADAHSGDDPGNTDASTDHIAVPDQDLYSLANRNAVGDTYADANRDEHTNCCTDIGAAWTRDHFLRAYARR